MRMINPRRVARVIGGVAVSATAAFALAACSANGTTDPNATAAATETPGPATAPTATAPNAGTDPAATNPNYACGVADGWGTREGGRGERSTAPLFNVKVGRHTCYDRVVFPVDGTALAGFDADYVPAGTASASGQAAIQITVGAPVGLVAHAAIHPAEPHWAEVPADGAPAVSATIVAGLPNLDAGPMSGSPVVTEVRYTGPSADGGSTFVIGATAKQPFNVGSFARSGIRFIYVDIAH
jgi:hypothetical protein